MHILSPETDNCPSWISGRERMTVEKYFMINLHERMLPTSVGGWNPRPPGLQSDGASNWATEAGRGSKKILKRGDREERGTRMKVKKQNEHIPHCTLTCYKDSRPCPINKPISVGRPSDVIHDTFAPPDHPAGGFSEGPDQPAHLYILAVDQGFLCHLKKPWTL